MKVLTYPSSGSVAGQTASRNRFGQYIRTRAVPVNPSSSFQAAVRSRFQNLADAWRSITGAQRTGWADLGLQIQRTDSLGQVYTLSPLQAFMSINGERLSAGDAVVNDAPLMDLPNPLVTLTPSATVSTFSVAYTVTPLAAGQRVLVFASPQRSAGRSFESDYRLIFTSAAAAASPANIFAAYVTRFGAPVVGAKIFVSASVYAAGFVSQPLQTSLIVA